MRRRDFSWFWRAQKTMQSAFLKAQPAAPLTHYEQVLNTANSTARQHSHHPHPANMSDTEKQQLREEIAQDKFDKSALR